MRQKTRVHCLKLSSLVRSALRPPAVDPLRRPFARQAERVRRRRGDARDPPRPARGRRQLQSRQNLHQDAEGALPGLRRAEQPRSRPAGGEDRQRGAGGADGRHRQRAGDGAFRPDRDPDGRPAGLGQDDRLRQARPLLQEDQQGRRDRRLRRLPAGRGRAAGHRRRARRRPRLRARHRRRPGRDRRVGAAAGEDRAPRRPHRRHRRAPAHRPGPDVRALPDPQEDEAARRPPRRRRDDRPGRRRRRRILRRGGRVRRRRDDQARRRRPRRRRALGQSRHRQADPLRLDRREDSRTSTSSTPTAWPSASSAWATSSA